MIAKSGHGSRSGRWLATIIRLDMRTTYSRLALMAACFLGGAAHAVVPAEPWAFIDQQIAAHPQSTGVYVLERGEEALLARAWFGDNARHSIDIQYFIWSADNVGELASAAILHAAQRGVRVRIIVDDLLIDAPDQALLALAQHPNIDIRIYNPRHSVGTRLPKRVLNIATDFRGSNQRMHDKTFAVDGRIAITGGRNMADEYFDFDHAYNFRDRDALLVGEAVAQVNASFERFWQSALSVPVEELYDGYGLMKKNVKVDSAEVQAVYRELERYSADDANFTPAIRASIRAIPAEFPRLSQELRWTKARFLSDMPGKNDSRFALDGGGRTTAALAQVLAGAKREVLIESPYLVLSDPAMKAFKALRERGVRVRICTNSLASTDNLQAFSGYRNQRAQLLAMGLEIHEYRPDPKVRMQVMQRYQETRHEAPVFALHAKTMVVDEAVVFVGTYNLDPRSENLNTEAGVVVEDAVVAARVAQAIRTDLEPENSWNAATDAPDGHAAFAKRSKVRFWQMLPIKPLL
jgi:cardiolipin synthase C